MTKKTSLGIVLLAVLVCVPTAIADKGGGGKSSDPPSLVVIDSSDGLPHWGNHVTFNISTTASWPSVTLTCYQNGTAVLTQSAGFWPDYGPGQVFGLMNGTWTSGAADCTATLYALSSNGKSSTLGSTSFHVFA